MENGNPRPGTSILLAEDNPVNREVIQIMLEVLGCQVCCVSNGREAVQEITGDSGQSFNLVLMDVHMPEMDGMEATRAVRQWESLNAGTARTPIVALTASAGDHSQSNCLEAGMDGFIIKPIQQDGLRDVIQQYGNHGG